MITYQEARQELKKAGKSLQGFTQDFFNLYVYEHRNGFKNVFQTDFYKNNGSSYCEFLSIYTEHLPSFDLYGHLDAWQKEKICRVSAEDVQQALMYARDFEGCYSKIEAIAV